MDLQGGTPFLSVRKRDGVTIQDYRREKIRAALEGAWLETGLTMDGEVLDEVINDVAKKLEYVARDGVVDVERIQDLVEMALMTHGQFDVAKAYIVYRSKRSEVRQTRLQSDPNAIADYIHPSKYARYLPELKRREVYEETVGRVESMHLKKFKPLFQKDPGLEKEIRWAFDRVRERRVLPSMRSMQFAGPAIESVNARIFNCSACYIDDPKIFGKILFLLLAGAGVGFSIQYDHVDKLPPLKKIDTKNVRHFTIPDSIEGWGYALDRLVDSYIKGYYLELNYSKIRPEGTPLETSGGRAPGHLRLKEALEHIRLVLDQAAGRRLRPIECYDLLCIAADAVLSGGIRRSSMIALFSLEDGEMMNAKTGDWFKKYPWRANCNNSVVLKRDEVKKKAYKRIFNYTREFGEPGFEFLNSYEDLYNPCSEAGFRPILTIDEGVLEIIAAREARGKVHPRVKLGDTFTAIGLCNLAEINAAKFKTLDDMLMGARAATIIATLQATYTELEYLGWASEVLAERDALIGVSMTGIMDAPEIALNPEYQKTTAGKIIEWNREFAARLGTRPAARCTVVKPSGTGSLELRCVGPGVHAHHARRYLRRVTANENEPVFQYFKSINPHMVQRKDNGDYVIEFPVEAPDGAMIKADLTAIQFLEIVKNTQINWILPGTARPEAAPGLTNNVSNTCVVKPEEWDQVAEYLWENKQYFTGVSFIPSKGDKIYQWSPNEAITTEADEAKWNHLIRNYKPIDYSKMVEEDDATALTSEPACAGGACLL